MKKLLVIAVATALIAPAAAMADTTLYGKLHATVGTLDTGAATDADMQVENNNSRFGIKGSTELDNGLAATYGLEMSVDIDGDAASNLGSRNQFVGVKGGFGEVRIGKHDTPAKLSTAGLDAFADNNQAEMSGIIAADNHRVNNAVAYINKFGPVGFAVAHSTDVLGDDTVNTAGAALNNSANTAMANYSTGPIYLGAGYTAVENVGTDINIGAGYKHEAGHFANVVYETVEGDGVGAPAVAGFPGGASTDTNMYVAGGFKTGAATLKAAYGSSDRDTGGEETNTTVGVDYALGKKTSTYLMWNERDNAGHAVVSADKVTATQVGLVTEF
ncbi:MAG: hypothetical protein BWK73_40690 [Thiothrix lacustris]|uniref:Porin domain-containing protein n=1 Tax=Thiothrix lacustris TaxID=525917 RepID=A0A1Y1QDL2_9GAMM|nr:MAG: hypothetical protein BWK73_40690 [Thiothrix lacustris]